MLRGRRGSDLRQVPAGTRLERYLDFLDDTKSSDWEDRERYLVQVGKLVQALEVRNFPQEALPKLRRAIEAQIRDLRSAIVKETCKLIATCVEYLQNEFVKTATALLPTMLDLIASGNKVIASHVDKSCCNLIEKMRLPALIPRLTTLLKESKSNNIRESCINYVSILLKTWSTKSLQKNVMILQEMFAYVLRDASSTVRSRARESFVLFAAHFPEVGRELLGRFDERTQRALSKVIQNTAMAAGRPPLIRAYSHESIEVHREDEHEEYASHSPIPASAPQPPPAAEKFTTSEPDQQQEETKDEEERISMKAVETDEKEMLKSSSESEGTTQNIIYDDDEDNIVDEWNLEELVIAHRVHINESIEALAEDLKILKAHEKLVRVHKENGQILDPSIYSKILKESLKKEQRRVDEMTSLMQRYSK